MFKAALPVSSALTPFRPLAASQMPPANVMLDSREQMEASALRAVSTNTKKSRARVIALIVHPPLSQQLAASTKQNASAPFILPCHWTSACATLGLREQMEASALRAVSSNTKKSWARVIALIVHQTIFLQLAQNASGKFVSQYNLTLPENSLVVVCVRAQQPRRQVAGSLLMGLGITSTT